MSTGKTSRTEIPYPVDTDTANIASDMEQLAKRVDAIIPPWSSGSTPPSSPIDGQIWWNTNNNSSSYAYGLNYWSSAAGVWTAIGDDIQVVSSDPSTPYLNLVIYNTTTKALKYYNGSTWINVIPAVGTTNYVYVAGSSDSASSTSWKALPESAAKTFYNGSNNTAITTTGVSPAFGTIDSFTGYSKYEITVSVACSLSVAGATALSSGITKSTGTVTGGFYTAVPSTMVGVINVSYTGIVTCSASDTQNFGATVTKTGAGTVTSYGAGITIKPLAY